MTLMVLVLLLLLLFDSWFLVARSVLCACVRVSAHHVVVVPMSMVPLSTLFIAISGPASKLFVFVLYFFSPYPPFMRLFLLLLRSGAGALQLQVSSSLNIRTRTRIPQ